MRVARPDQERTVGHSQAPDLPTVQTASSAVLALQRQVGNRAVGKLLRGMNHEANVNIERIPVKKPITRLLQRSDEEAGEAGSRPNLDVGDTGPGVKLLQSLLGVRQTGVFDEATRRAVIAYQRARPWLHPATGGVGPMTWESLDSRRGPPSTGEDVGTPGNRPNLDLGDRGPGVTLLQRLLLIRQSGVFDETTRRAVIAFQEARPWLHPATGGVGSKTWDALDRQLSAGAGGEPKAAVDTGRIDHVVTGEVVVVGKSLGEGTFTPADSVTDSAVRARINQIAAAGATVVTSGDIAVGTMVLSGVATLAPAATATAGGGSAAAGGAVAGGALVPGILIGAIVVAGTILIVASFASQAKELDELGGTSLPGGIADAPVLPRVGDQIRSLTAELAQHLARLTGSEVAGMPPDHQRDPDRDKKHWCGEIKNLIKEIAKHKLTPKQMWRELSKKYTKEQIEEIIATLKKVASTFREVLEEDPPDYPPVALP